MTRVTYHDFQKVGRNLYCIGNTYFRLFGHSITPNGCWVASPSMKQIVDIDIATGKDVYGEIVIGLETGTVPPCDFVS